MYKETFNENRERLCLLENGTLPDILWMQYFLILLAFYSNQVDVIGHGNICMIYTLSLTSDTQAMDIIEIDLISVMSIWSELRPHPVTMQPRQLARQQTLILALQITILSMTDWDTPFMRSMDWPWNSSWSGHMNTWMTRRVSSLRTHTSWWPLDLTTHHDITIPCQSF